MVKLETTGLKVAFIWALGALESCAGVVEGERLGSGPGEPLRTNPPRFLAVGKEFSSHCVSARGPTRRGEPPPAEPRPLVPQVPNAFELRYLIDDYSQSSASTSAWERRAAEGHLLLTEALANGQVTASALQSIEAEEIILDIGPRPIPREVFARCETDYAASRLRAEGWGHDDDDGCRCIGTLVMNDVQLARQPLRALLASIARRQDMPEQPSGSRATIRENSKDLEHRAPSAYAGCALTISLEPSKGSDGYWILDCPGGLFRIEQQGSEGYQRALLAFQLLLRLPGVSVSNYLLAGLKFRESNSTCKDRDEIALRRELNAETRELSSLLLAGEISIAEAHVALMAYLIEKNLENETFRLRATWSPSYRHDLPRLPRSDAGTRAAEAMRDSFKLMKKHLRAMSPAAAHFVDKSLSIGADACLVNPTLPD